MKETIFSSAARVLKNMLDWVQLSKNERIANDTVNIFTTGVLKNSQLQLSGLEDTEFKIVTGTGSNPDYRIKVTEGVAYDTIGERIVIDSAGSTKGYNLTDCTLTAYNGSSYVSTPKLSGADSILLTNGLCNYVWVSYLEVCDSSFYTLHKATHVKQFYKWDDGFKINITTTGICLTLTTPTAPVGVSNPMLLAAVDLSGSPSHPVDYNVVTKYNSRTYAGTRENRVRIKTAKASKVDVTTSYPSETEMFLDDHIKAVGAGSPSSANPHGTTLSDIGASEDEIVAPHQLRMHADGIIGSSTDILHIGTTGLTATITNLQSGQEFINIGGTIITHEIIADANSIIDGNGDVILALSPSITAYYIQVANTGVISCQSSVIGSNLPLYQISTSTIDVPTGYTADLRVYGTTNSVRTIRYTTNDGTSYTPDVGVRMLRGSHTFTSIGGGAIGSQAVSFPTLPKQFFTLSSLSISCGVTSVSSGGSMGSDFIVGADSTSLTGFTLRCQNNAFSAATNVVVSWVVMGV